MPDERALVIVYDARRLAELLELAGQALALALAVVALVALWSLWAVM